MSEKMIYRIATLELHTYAAFCRWLRKSQGTTIGALIKESDVIQDSKLTEFLILTEREELE